MEAILSNDNIAIAVLAAAYIEQRRLNSALRKSIDRQWGIIEKFSGTLSKMKALMQMEQTGQFYRHEFPED